VVSLLWDPVESTFSTDLYLLIWLGCSEVHTLFRFFVQPDKESQIWQNTCYMIQKDHFYLGLGLCLVIYLFIFIQNYHFFLNSSQCFVLPTGEHSHTSISWGYWFQDPGCVPKATDVQVLYLKIGVFVYNSWTRSWTL
jgi:hypothetical protein